MGKLIDLATRRRAPESPKFAKVAPEDAPFVNREPVNPPAPEKPHPVHQAARAMALSRMATADLTRCQRREAALKSASLLARCPRMKMVWQNKADHIALAISGDFAPLVDGQGDAVEFAAIVPAPAEVKQVRLFPWLLVGLSVALAIAVTPPFWVS